MTEDRLREIERQAEYDERVNVYVGSLPELVTELVAEVRRLRGMVRGKWEIVQDGDSARIYCDGRLVETVTCTSFKTDTARPS
jgi:hypothetical protein